MHVSPEPQDKRIPRRWAPRQAGFGPMTAAHEPLSFEALIMAVADRRDKKAFTTLFGHFAPRVKTYLQRGGIAGAIAEDMMQDVLLTVWNKAEQFDPGRASAQAWIFGIARNLKIDLLRRSRLLVQDAAISEEAPVPLADAIVEAEQASRSIRRAIDELPEDQVAVLRLAFFEDLSHGEIEKALGVPLGTVKSRLRLALAKLRRALGNDA